MLQSRYCMNHRILHIFRQRRRHTTHIHLICKFTLRLNKQLMAVFVRELHDLILNRRTVSRSGSLNKSREERRTVNIILDNLMCFLVRISQPAGNLIPLDIFLFIRKGKWNDMLVTLLFLHLGKINRFLIETCRCTCLESPDKDTCIPHRIRQVICC